MVDDDFLFERLRKPVGQLKSELPQYDNVLWKESCLSMHYCFSEIVIHILMYKNSDVFLCYDKVRELYLNKDPILYSFEVCVYFMTKMDDGTYHQFPFMSFRDFLAKENFGDPFDVNVYDIIDRKHGIFG